jgi:hypothetical protein
MVTKRRPSFDPKSFLARVVTARGHWRCGLLHPKRRDEAHRRFRARQGGDYRNFGAEEFFGEGYSAGQAQRIATVLPGNKRRKGPMKLRANCVIILEICLARPKRFELLTPRFVGRPSDLMALPFPANRPVRAL